jgi:hypothetical protein
LTAETDVMDIAGCVAKMVDDVERHFRLGDHPHVAAPQSAADGKLNSSPPGA